MKQKLTLFFVAVAVKIPFLNLGYGPEEDAWGHVQNIAEMKTAGHYIMSRLPGHPVYEALLYLLWPVHSPLVYNLLSAVASGFAVVAFYKLCTHFKIKKAFWVTLGFMFVPAFFLSGTYTIDYALGLALVLWSYWFLVKEKLWLSALLLGLAVGTRITWVLMLLPWLLQLNGTKLSEFNINKSLQFLAVFGLVVVAAFIPVYNQYGISFFNTYSLPYPPISKAIYKGIFGVWGILGAGVLFLIFVVFIKHFKRIKTQFTPQHFIWLLPIIFYTLLYIKLPEKSAFFIPVIPFLFFIIFTLLKEKWIKPTAISFVVSLFLFGINISDELRGSTPKNHDPKIVVSNQEIFFSLERGLFFLELDKRKNKIKSTEKFIAELQALDNQKTVVICGWWYAMIDISATAEKALPENIILKYYLNQEEMRHYTKNGFELFYLPEQFEINERRNVIER